VSVQEFVHESLNRRFSSDSARAHDVISSIDVRSRMTESFLSANLCRGSDIVLLKIRHFAHSNIYRVITRGLMP
jgi:hypothetical protein